MRAIFLSLFPLMMWSIAAPAMNWEGHDDWMADMEPALVYEKAAPAAAPQKQQTCGDRQEREHNPYEQIELDRGKCPPSPAPAPAPRE